MNANADKYCDCHYKHQEQIAEIRRSTDTANDVHEQMWKVIRGKVDIKFFVVLIGIVIGLFSFNFLIYNTIKAVELKATIIEVNLSHHLKECELLKRAGARAAGVPLEHGGGK